MAQINKPNTYFNTVPYSGVNSSQSITGVNFQPDFTWIKCRNNGQEHMLFDSIRGVTNYLQSDTTIAEATNANSLTSFDSDGFSLGFLGEVNAGTYTYVSWNWLGGGTASSNTDGTITSSVSANTTSGFSIVSYSGNSTGGATIGHGLGTTPAMFIIKNRTTAGEHWVVYHQSISPSNMLYLNLTNAQDPANQFNSTAPTSSVFSVSSNIMVNASSNNYIAYCFAEKKGFSKFGSYTGNGSTDGPFVYTGFKPAFIILKRSDSVADWFLHDNKRNGFNPDNDYLQPNLNSVETNFDGLIDFTSNGFKIRTTSTAYNASGGTYIYMAFAENPLVGTNNIPATAR